MAETPKQITARIDTTSSNKVIPALGNVMQYDSGVLLLIYGLNSIANTEAQFAKEYSLSTISVQLEEDTDAGCYKVTIPALVTFLYGKTYLYLYVATQNQQYTKYTITFNVTKRPKIQPVVLTSEELSSIHNSITELVDKVATKTYEDLSQEVLKEALGQKIDDLKDRIKDANDFIDDLEEANELAGEARDTAVTAAGEAAGSATEAKMWAVSLNIIDIDTGKETDSLDLNALNARRSARSYALMACKCESDAQDALDAAQEAERNAEEYAKTAEKWASSDAILIAETDQDFDVVRNEEEDGSYYYTITPKPSDSPIKNVPLLSARAYAKLAQSGIKLSINDQAVAILVTDQTRNSESIVYATKVVHEIAESEAKAIKNDIEASTIEFLNHNNEIDNKVYSAVDKNAITIDYKDVGALAKENPEGTGSLSINRLVQDLNGNTIDAGTNVIILGKDGVATGNQSIAIGGSVRSTGNSSIVIGNESTSNASKAVAIGSSVQATTNLQVVVGKYNASDNNASFIVGGGSSEQRENIIAASKDLFAVSSSVIKATINNALVIANQERITAKIGGMTSTNTITLSTERDSSNNTYGVLEVNEGKVKAKIVLVTDTFSAENIYAKETKIENEITLGNDNDEIFSVKRNQSDEVDIHANGTLAVLGDTSLGNRDNYDPGKTIATVDVLGEAKFEHKETSTGAWKSTNILGDTIKSGTYKSNPYIIDRIDVTTKNADGTITSNEKTNVQETIVLTPDAELKNIFSSKIIDHPEIKPDNTVEINILSLIDGIYGWINAIENADNKTYSGNS